MSGESPKLLSRGALAGAGALLSLELALTACGADEVKKDAPSAEKTPDSIPGPSLSAKPEPVKSYVIQFDNLVDKDESVRVYKGFGDTDADKQFVGRYNDGDTLGVECLVYGRMVRSNYEGVGDEKEPKRQSDVWLRSVTGQYVTVVYIKDPEQSISELPHCPAPVETPPTDN